MDTIKTGNLPAYVYLEKCELVILCDCVHEKWRMKVHEQAGKRYLERIAD